MSELDDGDEYNDGFAEGWDDGHDVGYGKALDDVIAHLRERGLNNTADSITRGFAVETRNPDEVQTHTDSRGIVHLLSSLARASSVATTMRSIGVDNMKHFASAYEGPGTFTPPDPVVREVDHVIQPDDVKISKPLDRNDAAAFVKGLMD